MFSRPSSCCFFIDLRVATLILATLQAISYGFQSYLIAYFGDDEMMTLVGFYSSVFLSLIGVYGITAVYKKDYKLVRTFAHYYWGEFIGHQLFSLAYLVLIANSSSELCREVAETYSEYSACRENYSLVMVVSALSFFFGLLIRLHYCFSIWAYYRKLEAEQSTKYPISAASQNYMVVATDEKASKEATLDA